MSVSLDERSESGQTKERTDRQRNRQSLKADIQRDTDSKTYVYEDEDGPMWRIRKHLTSD